MRVCLDVAQRVETCRLYLVAVSRSQFQRCSRVQTGVGSSTDSVTKPFQFRMYLTNVSLTPSLRR